MAAAARHALMRPAHAILSSNLPGHCDHSTNGQSSRETKDGQALEDLDSEERKERDSITRVDTTAGILPPQEIAQDPQNKALGKSSSALRIQDFDLVKTLGTGMPRNSANVSGLTWNLLRHICSGLAF